MIWFCTLLFWIPQLVLITFLISFALHKTFLVNIFAGTVHCLQYIYRPFKLHCLHKEQQMKAMPSWSSALAFAAQWWYIAVLFTKMYFDTDINPIFGHFKRSIPLPSLMLSISNFNTFIYLELKIWTGAVPPIKKFNWILPPFLFWVHRNETSMY